MQHSWKTEIGKAIYESLIATPEKWRLENDYVNSTRWLQSYNSANSIYLDWNFWGSYHKMIMSIRPHADYYPEYLSKDDVILLVATANKLEERRREDELFFKNVVTKEVIFNEAAKTLARAVLADDDAAVRPLIDCCMENLS
jgi:hypothetical protein